MKKILTILAAAMFIFASCDKIDNDEYIVFAGANGAWYDSEMEEIPSVQRAFLEKYTGVRCVNCPAADEAIHIASEKYGDKLIVAAIHAANNFGKPIGNDPDLRTDKGSIWFNEFIGSLGLPAAMVNRNTEDLFTPTSGIDDRVDNAIVQQPKVSLFMKAEYSTSASYAEVHLGFDQAVNDALTLTVLIVEDKIHTTQLSGHDQIENYEQNHVLRDIITDPWGIDVDADGHKGTKRMVRLSFNLRSDCNPDNCHIIAFVSDKSSKKILNVVQCDFE